MFPQLLDLGVNVTHLSVHFISVRPVGNSLGALLEGLFISASLSEKKRWMIDDDLRVTRSIFSALFITHAAGYYKEHSLPG
mmetsp:Transcript_7211/g.10705  ORF Transcript_7211/g.10705 Transcript_7211/m.10705 type:complete len:81 (-) Transcript_7211:33-275(-)